MNCIKKLLATTLTLAAFLYASERVYLSPFSIVGLNEDYGIAAEKGKPIQKFIWNLKGPE